MSMMLFHSFFPEQAEAETRTITLRGYASIPDGEYALVELYCMDPACDCRRVMLNVISRRQGHVATINYGFDRQSEMAGPFLDPLNPQSRYAKELLEAVSQFVLSDPAYVERLEAHYRKIKQALADTKHPIHHTLARLGGTSSPAPRRNEPARPGRTGKTKKRKRR